MKIQTLSAAPRKKALRAGRGDSARRGNFCARGMNGQNSRAGGGVRIGFEGGQTPLIKRMPKLRGFTSRQKRFGETDIQRLEKMFEDGATIGLKELEEKKVYMRGMKGVKVLANGEPTKKFVFSKGITFTTRAKEMLEKGGSTLEA